MGQTTYIFSYEDKGQPERLRYGVRRRSDIRPIMSMSLQTGNSFSKILLTYINELKEDADHSIPVVVEKSKKDPIGEIEFIVAQGIAELHNKTITQKKKIYPDF